MVVQMYMSTWLCAKFLDERHGKTLIRANAIFFAKKIFDLIFFNIKIRAVAVRILISLMLCIK